ncbi:hypothetical protein FG386_001130 [Cryptosporidium ryanae]|uniref:uncharacterized protein n=1 Tax=Cryptosporidium ryanae TaxID=515981 RepID=UPI00351A65AE|nr:hypothetical protein FG386_001130 [Cryptosporidium ryanae]
MGDNCDHTNISRLTVGGGNKLLECSENNMVGNNENIVFNSQQYLSSILENSKNNLNSINLKEKQHDETLIGGPFEYGNSYGYLYTKLKFILDKHDINDTVKDDLYSLLEVIGEMKVLGVYNEHYKKYRKAFDTYTLELDPSSKINEEIVGELRYLSFQNSVSGRKELRLIDKIIKEWNKRDKEKRLLQSCRGAMSDWLNKGELRTERNDSGYENMMNASKYILESIKGSNNSFQQSNLLSFLSESYVSEKLYPFILNHLSAGSPGIQTPAFVGYLNKDHSSAVCSSLSSIEEGSYALGTENNQTNNDGNNLKTCSSSNNGELSNDNLIGNNRVIQNESVIDWIKNNFRGQLNNLESIASKIQNGVCINQNKMDNELEESKIIISSRLVNNKPVEICDITSLYETDDLIVDYYDKYLELYECFLSMRENLTKKRSYYKSIPIIGSNRIKKQSVDIQEVRLRQYQTTYNDKNLPELQDKIRRVLIYRNEWKRPPMFLLLTHKGRECSGLNPMAKEEHINYDIDTDEEWEEQFGGEDVEDVDDGIENGDDDDDNEAVASGWLVPDGCFQSDELMDDVTISSTGNCGNASVVNLLSTSSEYPAPVVISFLNHCCIDFGAGISVPNDLSVRTLINEYLIYFPQNLTWIYSKTCANLNEKKRTFNESNDIYNQHECKNSSNLMKNTSLDISTKLQLLYFVYGKYSSIKKIIDDFMELDLERNIKRSSIIHFLKENIYKAKIGDDCKPRWYINNNSGIELDKNKLEQLLMERSLGEKTESINCKLESKECSKIKQDERAIQYLNVKTPAGTLNKRKFLEENEETSKLDKFAVNIIKDNEIYKDICNISRCENCVLNSQRSSIDENSVKSVNYCCQDERITRDNIFTGEKDSNINTNGNKKKRKYSNRNGNIVSTSQDGLLVNSEENKIESINENRSDTPEIKRNFTPVHNNSLITEFFQLKNRDN